MGHRIIGRSCLSRRALLLGAAAIFAAGRANARETYAAYVARINAGLPGGARFRPDLENVLFGSANAYRAQNGLKGLQKGSDLLVSAARAHAADMMENDFVGHTSSSGAGFESRMRALHPGVMMLPRMAENAARERSKGPPNEAKAGKLFQQWVHSGSHARTLRSRDYITVATGVVEKDGKLFAVQIFEGPEMKSNMFGTAGAGQATTPKTEMSGGGNSGGDGISGDSLY
ncbi:MAG: CAP domain-containing protein [Rhizobiales bacterium]|nr:CAP domain-containing protein [Hyphomicrobiales bacterium]